MILLGAVCTGGDSEARTGTTEGGVSATGTRSRSVEFDLFPLSPCATTSGTLDPLTVVSTREETTEALATALTAKTTTAICHTPPMGGAKPNSDQEFALKRIPVPNCDVTSLSLTEQPRNRSAGRRARHDRHHRGAADAHPARQFAARR